MTLLDQVRHRLTDISARVYKQAFELKLGMLGTVKKIVLPAIPEVMAVLQETAADGAVKKAAALAYLSELYDQYIAPIDLPGPIDRLLHRLAKKYMLVAANALIDDWFAFLSSPNAARIVAAFQKSA